MQISLDVLLCKAGKLQELKQKEAQLHLDKILSTSKLTLVILNE